MTPYDITLEVEVLGKFSETWRKTTNIHSLRNPSLKAKVAHWPEPQNFSGLNKALRVFVALWLTTLEVNNGFFSEFK